MLSAFVGAVLHALLPSRFLTAAQVVARLADRRIGYSEAIKMLQVGQAGGSGNIDRIMNGCMS